MSSKDETFENNGGVGFHEKELIQQLQKDNKKILVEFNLQRAKLKELFTKKETELSKAQEANKLLQEQINKLKTRFLLELNSERRAEVPAAQEQNSSIQGESSEKNINLITQIIRVQSTNTTNEDPCQKYLLEHSKNVNQDVQSLPIGQVPFNRNRAVSQQLSPSSADKQFFGEDAEVLRSIVVQLHSEMIILKEKLRDADMKLHTDTGVVAPSQFKEGKTCDMCIHNLETEIVSDQDSAISLETLIATLQECLNKEVALRKILEEQWQGKREAHKNEVMALGSQIGRVEQNMVEAERFFAETKQELLRQLRRVIDDRDKINHLLEVLQLDNNFLAGCYLATAEEIESQSINLPNSVIELQEFILRQQIQLIQARVAAQYEKKKYVNSLGDLKNLKDHFKSVNVESSRILQELKNEKRVLQDNLRTSSKKLLEFDLLKATLERKETELGRKISEMRVEIIELQDQKDKLTKSNNDRQNKIKNMQDDLATSEQVQKDFVKLSQNLQIALEALRGADDEVRWQDDDDVSVCPTCQVTFTVTLRKFHCRHCGHIYCDTCLNKHVVSGPRKRMARVCDICHTLLSPNTAPYFSHTSSKAHN